MDLSKDAQAVQEAIRAFGPAEEAYMVRRRYASDRFKRQIQDAFEAGWQQGVLEGWHRAERQVEAPQDVKPTEEEAR